MAADGARSVERHKLGVTFEFDGILSPTTVAFDRYGGPITVNKNHVVLFSVQRMHHV